VQHIQGNAERLQPLTATRANDQMPLGSAPVEADKFTTGEQR
jgi:hypothetical protein